VTPTVEPAAGPGADPEAAQSRSGQPRSGQPGTDAETGVRRAWGWLAHLQAGGTTPWAQWSEPGPPGGRFLPGAQQLELLRRLNEAGSPDPVLITRVLEASAPGRGRPDLELVGAAARTGFGPPPVDPADLRADELLRVATGLLAEDVVAAGAPEPERVPPPRLWRTRYRLVGDPMLADPRREDLIARGRPPGGRGSVILVLGTDLGQMLVDIWTARALSDGAPGWSEWLEGVSRSRTLPHRIDLLHSAQVWSERVGSDRIRIVLDLDLVPRLVGVRRPLHGAPVLSADATDLARRIGQVLGLLAVPERRLQLMRQVVVPRLLADPAVRDGAPLHLPREHRRWARRRAAHMRDGLLRAGYPVHGDPDSLLPVDRPGVDRPDDEGVLALAMRLLLEARAERGAR